MQYERRRNYEEAIEHYTKAIEIDPTSEVAALCYSNRSAAHQVRSMHCHFIALSDRHAYPLTLPLDSGN